MAAAAALAVAFCGEFNHLLTFYLPGYLLKGMNWSVTVANFVAVVADFVAVVANFVAVVADFVAVVAQFSGRMPADAT